MMRYLGRMAVWACVVWSAIMSWGCVHQHEWDGEGGGPGGGRYYVVFDNEWRRRLVEEYLEKTKTSIDIEDATFDECMSYLQIKWNMNYVIDGVAVSRSKDRRVTCHLKDVTLREALTQMLGPLGLAYGCEANGIYISTPEDVAAERYRAAHPKDGKKSTEEALDEMVSLDFERTSLDDVVSHLLEEYDLTVVVLDDEATGWQRMPVTYRATNVTMRDALTQMLQPRGLDYEVMEKRTVWVSTRDKVAERRRNIDVMRIYEKCLNEMTSVDFKDAAIEDVMASLHMVQMHGMSIILDRRALSGRDVKVTCKLKDVKLRDALTQMLRPYGLVYGYVMHQRVAAIYIGTPDGLIEYRKNGQ